MCRKGGQFELTQSARDKGLQLKDYFGDDGEFLPQTGGDVVRYFSFRPGKHATWTRPPPSAAAAAAAIADAPSGFIPLQSSTEGIAEDEGPQDPLVEATRRLNVQTREHPQDISAWLQLSRLQDQIAAGSRVRSRTGRAAVGEKRLAILSRALAANPDHVGLIRAYMRLWGEAAEPAESARKWMQVIRRRPGDTRLWSDLLASSMGRLSSFSVEESRRDLLRCVEDLAWERDRVVMENRGAREEERAERAAVGECRASRELMKRCACFLYVYGKYVKRCSDAFVTLYHTDALLRLLEFDRATGHTERFIAGCQAALEFELLAPPRGHPDCKSLDDRLLLFADFWRSRRPRLGEPSCLGFKDCLRAGWRESDAPASTSNAGPTAPSILVPAFSLKLAPKAPVSLPTATPLALADDDEEEPWRKRRPPPGRGPGGHAPLPSEPPPEEPAPPIDAEENENDDGSGEEEKDGEGLEDELDRMLQEAEAEAVRARLLIKLEEDLASLSAEEGGLTESKLRRYLEIESARESAQWLPRREVAEDDPLGPSRVAALEDVHPLLLGLRFAPSQTRLLAGVLALWGLELEGFLALAARPPAMSAHSGLPWFLDDAAGGRRDFVVRALRLLMDRGDAPEDASFLLAEALVRAAAGRAGLEGPEATPAELTDAEGRLRGLLAEYRDHPFLWLAYAQLQAVWAGRGRPLKTFRKVSAAVVVAVQTSGWQAAAWAALRLVQAEATAAMAHPTEAGSCGTRIRSLLLSLGALAFHALTTPHVSSASHEALGFQTALSEESRVLARRGFQAVVQAIFAGKGQLGSKDRSPRDPATFSSDPLQISLYGAAWITALALTEAFWGEPEAAMASLENLLPALGPPMGWTEWARTIALEAMALLSLEPGLGLAGPGAKVLTPARARAAIERAINGRGPTDPPPLRLLAVLEEMDRRAFAPSRSKGRMAHLWAKCSAALEDDTWATQGLTAESAQRAAVPLLVAATAAAARSSVAGQVEAVGMRHIFERALQHECLRQVPLVWSLYLAWEGCRGSRANVGRLVLRALSHCPWSKDVWMLGLRAALGFDTADALHCMLRAPGLDIGRAQLQLGEGRNAARPDGGSRSGAGARTAVSVRECHALLEAMRAKGLLVRTDILEVLLEEL